MLRFANSSAKSAKLFWSSGDICSKLRKSCRAVEQELLGLKLENIELGDLGRAAKADVERAMKGHVVAEAVLMGTYQKGD